MARRQQISPEDTPYYHCVSRCVRRAFLCGKDRYSGRDYEHRRGWLEERLLALQSVFCIDVCAYVVMSNHYHVVLHVSLSQAKSLSSKQVVDRWCSLFKGSELMQKFQKGDDLDAAELDAVALVVEEWRERLSSISWYMRCCNEWLAREANKEDECTGRFWEGRFKSQALLDEKALAACMVYVDLNPIRAKMESLPETSAFTSIKQRVTAAEQSQKSFEAPERLDKQPIDLYPFAGNPRNNMPPGLPFKLCDYLELVDWSSKQIKHNKRGFVPLDCPPILHRLGIDPADFVVAATQFESRFKTLAGALVVLRNKLHSFGFKSLSNKGVFR